MCYEVERGWPMKHVALFVLLLAGCGPAPYMIETEPVDAARDRDWHGAEWSADGRRVVVVEPLVRGDEDERGPFAVGQVWRGTYLCSQGETEMDLIVVDATAT